MVPGFHGLDLIVILVIALLIFGPKKLPEMGSAIGKSISEFKKGMSQLTEPKEEEPIVRSSVYSDNLDAIEREIASKRAAAAEAERARVASMSSEADEAAPVSKEQPVE